MFVLFLGSSLTWCLLLVDIDIYMADATSPSPSSNTNDAVRMERLKTLASEHRKQGKEQAAHIVSEPIGSDNSKQRKNKKQVDRGNHTTSARMCSAHLRLFYPQEILGDGEGSEFCVRGRHEEKCCMESNPCSLCFFHLKDNVWETAVVNLAEAIAVPLGGNIDRSNGDDLYFLRMNALMEKIIGCEYPDNKKSITLRIKVNEVALPMNWIEYYIKLVSHQSRLKAISPSGYKVQSYIFPFILKISHPI